MFGSLDYIYMPAADVDGETHRYVQTLGAELVWKVRGMGTTVACLRLGEPGPAILLSGHLGGAGAILVYRVPDYAATLAQLRERNVPVRGTGDTAWPVREIHDRRRAAVRGVPAHAAPGGSSFRRPYRPVEAHLLLFSGDGPMVNHLRRHAGHELCQRHDAAVRFRDRGDGAQRRGGMLVSSKRRPGLA
jgi:hypothetical protein